MRLFRKSRALLLIGYLLFAVSEVFGAAPVIHSSPTLTVNENSTYLYSFSANDADLTWSATAGTTLPTWLTLSPNNVVTTLKDAGGTNINFSDPQGVTVDSNGTIYVANSSINTISKVTLAGVVTTFAGSGTQGSTDGTGTAASFSSPRGLTVDSSGNVYVADTGNHKIRKITPAGVVTTFAGSGDANSTDGTGTAASFNAPKGIAIDSSGNVYVADTGNHNIRKITPAGVVTTLAGSGTQGSTDAIGIAASFDAPRGVTVDSSGNVYVADTNSRKIRKITPAGVVSTLAGSGADGFTDGTGAAASFANPYGITVDSRGNVYVTDTFLIRKITPEGVVTTIAGIVGHPATSFADGIGTAAKFFLPDGITLDNSGNVYLADLFNNKIRKLIPAKLRGTPTNADVGVHDVNLTLTHASDGSITHNFQITVVGSNATPVVTSTAITAVDEDSTYTYQFVASDADGDALTWSVTPTTTLPTWLSLSADGAVNTFAGSGDANSTDGAGTAASFNAPRGVAVDNSGNVYVADTKNHKIRKITSAGVVTTFAGSGSVGSTDATATAASFSSPAGVIVDSSGNVYVADTGNHNIRKITPAGVVTTLAGTGSSGSVNGTGTAASFNKPNEVTVDSSGNIYVAETGRDQIRKITPAGVVTTLVGSAVVPFVPFINPLGVTVDNNGNVYASNTGLKRIRKITPAGNTTTFVGGGSGSNTDGTGTDASFSSPRGLTVDSSGNIYLADAGNHNIRKITPQGVVTTLAGTGSVGSTDATGTAASFDSPNAIAIDSSGNIYIADTNNNKIRKITSAMLSGTPTNADVGVHDISLTLSDGNGGTTSHTFQITVANTDDAPTLSSITDVNASEDFSDLNITLVSQDDDGDTITYSASSSDTSIATVSIVGDQLYVVAAQNANGVITIEVNATANGVSTTQTFDINITSVNDAPQIANNIANIVEYKNFNDINISIGASDIDNDPLSYSLNYNTSLISASVVNDTLILSSIEGNSGTTDINITVSDANASVTKGFTLRVLSLDDSAEDIGTVSTSDIDGVSIVTIVSSENNLSIEILEDNNGSSVSSSITLAGNETKTRSNIANSLIELINNEVRILSGNVELISTILGEAIHRLTVDSKVTEIIFEFAGANTVLDKDMNAEVILTSTIDNAGTSITIVAKEDGSVEQTFTINSKVTEIISKILGTKTLIKTDGTVETTAGEQDDGNGYYIKGLATTKANGEITLKLIKVNQSDPTDVVDFLHLVTDENPLPAGSRLDIRDRSGELYLKATIRLDNNYEIK